MNYMSGTIKATLISDFLTPNKVAVSKLADSAAATPVKDS
jgi:hypothetical protein